MDTKTYIRAAIQASREVGELFVFDMVGHTSRKEAAKLDRRHRQAERFEAKALGDAPAAEGVERMGSEYIEVASVQRA